MAQLESTPISTNDMVEYLEKDSDFSFELRIVELLSGVVSSCEHGGTYADPVTGKTRQFDIRASIEDGWRRVWFAVECKNIREHFPVLVSCVPRRVEESYHEVFVVNGADERNSVIESFESKDIVIRVSGSESIYHQHDLVGKATAQIGRSKSDRQIVSNDGEVFEKWSQSLSSASDLAKRLDDDEGFGNESVYASALIPVVVVPEGMLWSVSYATTGERISDPVQVNRVSCFVGKEYEVATAPWLNRYAASHIELVTPLGLLTLMKKDFVESIFPEDSLVGAIN